MEQKSETIEKKKKCHTCKKKTITKLEPVEDLYIPSIDDIKLAYVELTNMKGVNEQMKPFISRVYQFIFNEQLNFDCRSCTSTQARKFNNYVNNELKLNL